MTTETTDPRTKDAVWKAHSVGMAPLVRVDRHDGADDIDLLCEIIDRMSDALEERTAQGGGR